MQTYKNWTSDFLKNFRPLSSTAYVDVNGNDNTAILGKSVRPFLTINAALDALPISGGVVSIGPGTFMSPLEVKIKHNTIFLGSGKPWTDSIVTFASPTAKQTITSPTKLIGGTILLGMFNCAHKDAIQIHNLGVDAGLEYCNTYNAGVATDALAFGQILDQTASRPRINIVINNVSCICKENTSEFHAIRAENIMDSSITNVSTYLGVHGLAVKGVGVNVSGVHAYGHAWSGIVLKCDSTAFGRGINLSNFYITSILAYDGEGLIITGYDDYPLTNTNITNGTIEFCKRGIQNNGKCQNINISNISILSPLTEGVLINQAVINSSFSNIKVVLGDKGFVMAQEVPSTCLDLVNCSSYGATTKGFHLLDNNTNGRFNLSNCISSCVGGSEFYGFGIHGNFKELTGALTGSPLQPFN